jgi:hypothetical protein
VGIVGVESIFATVACDAEFGKAKDRNLLTASLFNGIDDVLKIFFPSPKGFGSAPPPQL